MKRLRLVLATIATAALVLVPTTAAQANDGCSHVNGNAELDFGRNNGRARVFVDGERQFVNFRSIDFVETGPGTADITFKWFFDEGVITVVEHSASVPIGGPFLAIDSPVDVIAGGTGSMVWVGIVDVSKSIARFALGGQICFDE
ncbi:MAG: hypothetical protein HKN07_02770 [Acidimicrobiia bacterium]|nr:hypothetical protein [Acidimicrobiia bacterium]NNF63157.1 hypothetical protein [Acidimicrobiia bacterium]